MNRILVPLDGSEFAEQVLGAVRQFFAPDACELLLYRVGAPLERYTGIPPRPVSYEMPIPVYETERDLELAQHPIYDTQEAEARISSLMDELEPTAARLRAAGYTVYLEAELGNPAEAIIERARGHDIHLIAMTTHGRSGLSRLLFGSVAEQVVRHAPVPVLLVRPTPSEDDLHAPGA